MTPTETSTVVSAIFAVLAWDLAIRWRTQVHKATLKLIRERAVHKAAMEAKISEVRSDPNVRKGEMFILTAPTAWERTRNG